MDRAAQRKGLVHTLGMPQLGEEEEGKEQAGRPEGSLEAPLERDMFHILQDQALALGHLQFEGDPCFFLRNTDRVRVGTGLYGCCHEFGCSSLLFLLLLLLGCAHLPAGPATARHLVQDCQTWKRAIKSLAFNMSRDQSSVMNLKILLASLCCDDPLTRITKKREEDRFLSGILRPKAKK
ncbi:MFS transporter fsa7 [Fusarium oxysporum f. sp. albedinis]|nr:MFS transporter fsa7 [Fusarium oxysporum f. sp. albedinis]